MRVGSRLMRKAKQERGGEVVKSEFRREKVWEGEADGRM